MTVFPDPLWLSPRIASEHPDIRKMFLRRLAAVYDNEGGRHRHLPIDAVPPKHFRLGLPRDPAWVRDEVARRRFLVMLAARYATSSGSVRALSAQIGLNSQSLGQLVSIDGISHTTAKRICQHLPVNLILPEHFVNWTPGRRTLEATS